MDPATVIVLLSTHLIASGGLFYLISRRMPAGIGMRHWAAGAMVFGLAYLARISLGAVLGAPLALLTDSAMVLGAALLWVGQLRWVGAAHVPARTIAAGLALYVLVHILAVALWADAGRYLLLNLALAVLYLLAARTCARAVPQQAEGLGTPLVTLAVLTGGLGLATLARALYILPAGTGPLFAGVTAQAYYGFSSLAVLLMAMNLVWMLFVRLNGQLQAMALHDALTGVLNRNGLNDHLHRHFADRQARALVFLVVDVDHFKRVNDQHGHATGDLVLRAVAQALASRVRGADRVARLGGEEFAIVCADGSVAVAQALGERVRSGVAAAFQAGGPAAGLPPCTVSVGVSQPASRIEDHTLALQQADRALYEAKAAGRDRVVVFRTD